MTQNSRAPLLIVGCLLLAVGPFAPKAAAADSDTIGPLMLDPRGADFTLWITHLKDDLYKHWPPEAGVPAGTSGHVVLQFTVARDGAVQRVRVKEAYGEPKLKDAAKAALGACRPQALPADYKPKSITIELRFSRNDDPPGMPR